MSLFAAAAHRRRQQRPLGDLLAGLSQQQQSFVRSRARLRIVGGGRRSGKTESFVAALVAVAAGRPGAYALYISLTRTLAKHTVWERIKARLRRIGLDFRADETELILRVVGGGQIRLGGADDRREIEKYRSLYYDLVIVDECGAQADYLLRPLVVDVLRPALMDHGGSLVLGGTPAPLLAGFWYERDGPHSTVRAARWRWTIADNPLFAGRWQDELAAVREENGWDESNPTYQREYLGIWVQDLSVLVYPFDPAFNAVDELPRRSPTGVALPPGDWRHVIGVDVGQTSATAMVVLGTHRLLPDEYLVHSEGRPGMLTHEIAGRLRELVTIYHAGIVLDSGGMGAQHAAEFAARFPLPITPAKKTEKRAQIRSFRDRLIAGRIKLLNLPTLDPVRDEWAVLGWDPAAHGLDHHPAQADHFSDAALYADRELAHYRAEQAAMRRRPIPWGPDFDDDDDDAGGRRIPVWEQ
jgi:hypothetical protein